MIKYTISTMKIAEKMVEASYLKKWKMMMKICRRIHLSKVTSPISRIEGIVMLQFSVLAVYINFLMVFDHSSLKIVQMQCNQFRLMMVISLLIMIVRTKRKMMMYNLNLKLNKKIRQSNNWFLNYYSLVSFNSL